MAKLKSLEELFIEQMRDLYHAEHQLIKALPKMARAASTPELKQGFEEHLQQTRGHAERLEQIFTQLGMKARGKRCEAMEGLVAEGQELIHEDADPAVK